VRPRPTASPASSTNSCGKAAEERDGIIADTSVESLLRASAAVEIDT
jgi:hypothetical protein